MSEQQLTLSEAVTMFLATLSPGERQRSQHELNKFVRWYGGERRRAELSAREIGGYGSSISTHVTDAVNKLEPVRSFLAYAKKKKLVAVSLAPHLRVSKAKLGKLARGAARETAPIHLTAEGHAALKAELKQLTSERPRIVEQIRHAAADKDFRENAPLEAAKEHQGKIEARIREIEATLNAATIIDEKPRSTLTVGVGCTVEVSDLASDDRVSYTLVSPSESNPAKGKLSIASPIGKALLDGKVGAVVEVEAPVGRLRYRIEDVRG